MVGKSVVWHLYREIVVVLDNTDLGGSGAIEPMRFVSLGVLLLMTRMTPKLSLPHRVAAEIAGCQLDLCGRFDGEESSTALKYECRAVCIDGNFKPANQNWVRLNRFERWKDERARIFCGVYGGHGILRHNAATAVVIDVGDSRSLLIEF